MGLKLHPRYFSVKAAENDLGVDILKTIGKYDLTVIEVIAILNKLTSHYATYAIRDERHPDDPDKKGDEA